MKILISLLIIYSCSHYNFGQSAALLLEKKQTIAQEVSVILVYADSVEVENYTYFKGRYWFNLSNKQPKENWFKTHYNNNKTAYKKLPICDSAINTIRNNAYYWQMYSRVNQQAKEEIGAGNNEFLSFKMSGNNYIKVFDEDCYSIFTEKVNTIEQKLIDAIEQIKKEKVNRYNYIKTIGTAITSNEVDAFLSNFNDCEIDYKALEQIITLVPAIFVKSITRLEEEFYLDLYYSIKFFPQKAAIKTMKKALKGVKSKSKRKRRIIRRINKTE